MCRTSNWSRPTGTTCSYASYPAVTSWYGLPQWDSQISSLQILTPYILKSNIQSVKHAGRVLSAGRQFCSNTWRQFAGGMEEWFLQDSCTGKESNRCKKFLPIEVFYKILTLQTSKGYLIYYKVLFENEFVITDVSYTQTAW